MYSDLLTNEFGQLLLETEYNYYVDSQGNIKTENSEIIELSLIHWTPSGSNKIYKEFINPTANCILSVTCKTLTGIDQGAIDQARSFPEVYTGALDWINMLFRFNFRLESHMKVISFNDQTMQDLIRSINHHELNLHPLFNPGNCITIRNLIEERFGFKPENIDKALGSVTVARIGPCNRALFNNINNALLLDTIKAKE